jgi:hypothetical protein
VCGILGTYDIGVDAGRWAAMSDALGHRGPDAAGTWTGPEGAERVRLGHRRLSIIDLSAAANQPFVNGRRAGPSASWPLRTCPRRRRSVAATPHFDVGELHELLDPELWPRVDQLIEEHAAVTTRARATIR